MGRPDSFGLVHSLAVRRDIRGPPCGSRQLLRGNRSGHDVDDRPSGVQK
jgi:hypothetical protein